MSIAPESPIKIRAGSKLWGKKPAQIPTRMAQIIAGGYAETAPPWSWSTASEYNKIAEPAIMPRPAASPSIPSTKFTALMSRTVNRALSTMPCV